MSQEHFFNGESENGDELMKLSWDENDVPEILRCRNPREGIHD